MFLIIGKPAYMRQTGQDYLFDKSVSFFVYHIYNGIVFCRMTVCAYKYILIRYRKAKKITQADISENTGIQRPNISRLESGKYNPTLDMIVRVADSIGLEVEITLKEKKNQLK